MKPLTPPEDEGNKQEEIKPQALDWSLALNHLNKIEEDMKSLYAGKDGVNPFVWIAKNVAPLRTRAQVDTRNEALYATIMSLRCETPTVPMIGNTGILTIKPGNPVQGMEPKIVGRDDGEKV